MGLLLLCVFTGWRFFLSAREGLAVTFEERSLWTAAVLGSFATGGVKAPKEKRRRRWSSALRRGFEEIGSGECVSAQSGLGLCLQSGE